MRAFLFAALLSGPILLTWSKAPESNIAGYVIYVGRVPGQYIQSFDVGLTSTPDAPSYLFPTAPDGTYYFVVTAKDTTGHESEKSNEVSKTVPAPMPVTVYEDPP